MKKNLFYIAAILIASICATSCSNGDDETTNGATPQQSKNSEVTLRGTLANGVTTRSTITVNGSNLTSTWAGTDNVPEEIAVRYQMTNGSWGLAKATVKTAGETAAFEAKLTDPKTGTPITLVYPYSCYKSAEPYYDESVLTATAQTGTLADIGARLNIQTLTTTLNVDGETATLGDGTTQTLEPQVCIAQFNLQMKHTGGSYYAPYYASNLVIAVDGVDKYTVAPSISRSTFYVAMSRIESEKTVTLKATGNTYTYSADLDPENTKLTSSAVGKIIGVDHANSNQAKLYTKDTGVLTKNFNAVLKEGEFYNVNVKIGEDITPIAVVAYAGNAVSGYCENFIALALEDVTVGYVQNSESQSLVNTWLTNHSLKIGNDTYDALNENVAQYGYDVIVDDAETALNSNINNAGVKGWRLPTIADWRLTFRYLCSKNDSRIDLGASVLDFTPFLNEADKNLITLINNACGNNEIPNVGTATYWTGSHFNHATQGEKIWRANLYNALFDWLTPENNAHIRMLLAW